MPQRKSPTWKETARRYNSDLKFGRPATEKRIAAVEQALAVQFPRELRKFLLEADGITDEYGAAAIWSTAEIERQNVQFRTTEDFRDLYMPFNHLLFFGADAGGDHFAYAIHADGKIHKHDIYRWDHETDARQWFAARLEMFFERRLKAEDA